MADIRPFPGLRYDPARAGPLADLLCPPFDVISAEEQSALYARSPYNVIRLELGEDRQGDDAAENRHTRAGAHLCEWLRGGILHRDAERGVYLYEHAFRVGGGRHTRRGLLAAVRLRDWQAHEIIPHESTMAGPKEDRLRLMRATAANLSPIMVLYEDVGGSVSEALSAAWASPPVASIEAGDPGEKHRLRRCTDASALRGVAAALRGQPLYIADGHHRYETALCYRDERRAAAGQDAAPDAAWNFIMMLLIRFDDPGLVVLGTHRLVRGVQPARLATLPEVLEQWCRVERLPASACTEATLRSLLAATAQAGGSSERLFLLCLGRDLYRVTLNEGMTWTDGASLHRSAAWQALDVALADTLVLERGCGLGEREREQGEQVAYTQDPLDAVERVRRGSFQLAVLLGSTPASQLRAVADAQDRMPQKSTYFYPKPMTGLVLHELEGWRPPLP